jgi:hypothetical protein
MIFDCSTKCDLASQIQPVEQMLEVLQKSDRQHGILTSRLSLGLRRKRVVETKCCGLFQRIYGSPGAYFGM